MLRPFPGPLGVRTVDYRRLAAVFVGGAILLSACAGAAASPADEQAVDAVPAAQTADTGTEPATGETTADTAVVTVEAGTDAEIEAQVKQTRADLEALAAECAAGAGRVQPGADFSNRTFTGPDLRCADLSNSSFRNATLVGVDLSGANLAGADFTNATVTITAPGADFSGAVLSGADFTTSDLRGAVFTGADLVGSDLTRLPYGLSLATLDGTRLGCNRIYGGAYTTLVGATVETSCTAFHGYNRATLGGSWYGADLTGLDTTNMVIESTDFRLAVLDGANLADYGIWPQGSDFSGASLASARLSGIGFYETRFVSADMRSVDLSGSVITQSDLTSAFLDGAILRALTSEHNSYVGAVLTSVDLTDASLSFDDFTDATIDGINSANLVITSVACPGAVSTDIYGLCTVGSEVKF